MYQIQATYSFTDSNGWRASGLQVPTFYLHPAAQGIVSVDHAKRVAVNMIESIATANGPVQDLEVFAHVIEVSASDLF